MRKPKNAAQRLAGQLAYKKWYEAHKVEIREKKRVFMLKRRAENPDLHNKQSREAKKTLRDKIFSVYGSVCALCHFEDKRALTLDHIKNNGAAERKELGERGVYYKAIAERRDDEYRILCMNCQFITRVESQIQNQYANKQQCAATAFLVLVERLEALHG